MKNLNSIFISVILSIIFNLIIPLFAQQKSDVEISDNEILANINKILEYPVGLIKGRMTHITSQGSTLSVKMIGYAAKEDYLFKFTSRTRGDELKVLLNLKGRDIWVYHYRAIELFNKRGVDRFDPVLGTNYYFIDLSREDIQSNYNVKERGSAKIKGYKCYKLDLVPISKDSLYGLLVVYACKDDFVPIRIDYHDRDKIIFKTMSVVKVINKDDRIIPVRYDMLDIKRGTVTFIEFFSIDEEFKFDKKKFRRQNLLGKV